MPKLATVLLVDDDPTANFLHQLLLNKMGVADRLLLAENGAEALQLLVQTCAGPEVGACPVLVLLDVNMPVMGGVEFLEAYQQLSLPPPAAPRHRRAHDVRARRGAGTDSGVARGRHTKQTTDQGKGRCPSSGALSESITGLTGADRGAGDPLASRSKKVLVREMKRARWAARFG